MLSRRDWVAFFAGFESLHTLSHIMFRYSGTLPVKFFGIEWTQSLNTFGIVGNLVITVALLWWLSKETE